jgi:hypothetical protein
MLQSLEFSGSNLYVLGALGGIVLLLVILVASFLSRAKVFCQYLQHMAGISIRPVQVQKAYKLGGRGAVRDLLIDLLIQEDLADPSRKVTPDSKPNTGIYESDIFR